MIKLLKYLNDVKIGLLLSDGGLEKLRKESNIKLSVIMSTLNYGYILHI